MTNTIALSERLFPRTVWFVDDEPELGQAHADLFADDFDTRVFLSADEALAAFDSEIDQRPHAIVTDLRMPGTDGLRFVSKLRERKAKTPVIMMSGFAEKSDLLRAIGNGIESFLEKPCDPRVLRAEILSGLRQIEEAEAADRQIEILIIQTERYAALTSSYAKRFVHAENRLHAENLDLFKTREEAKEFVDQIAAERVLEKEIRIASETIKQISENRSTGKIGLA